MACPPSRARSSSTPSSASPSADERPEPGRLGARPDADGLAALAAALAVFGYVGWDGALWDARLQLILHLLAIGAIAGLGAHRASRSVSCRGRRSTSRSSACWPRSRSRRERAERGDEPPGDGRHRRLHGCDAAGRAAGGSPPPSLGRARDQRAGPAPRDPNAVAMLARRVEWIVVGAPGLPPLRLPAEGTAVRIRRGAALRADSGLGACRAHRADAAAPRRAHRPRGRRHSARDPVRFRAPRGLRSPPGSRSALCHGHGDDAGGSAGLRRLSARGLLIGAGGPRRWRRRAGRSCCRG